MKKEIHLLLNSCHQNPSGWKWLEWKENDLLDDDFPEDSKLVKVALPLCGGKGLINFLGQFFLIQENKAGCLLQEYREIGGFKDESRVKLMAEITQKEINHLLQQDLNDLIFD